MILPGQPIPDLLPLEPPEPYDPPEPEDEDIVYERWRDAQWER